MDHVVIIGAGQAGASLAEGLRKGGHRGRVTLIGAEEAPPYQRPPLSKAYLMGEMDEERLYLRPRAWYDENRIELRLGAPATAIDTVERTVAVGGERIAWDALALTTGADPRRLPANAGGTLEGVHVVRTLADVDAMRPGMIRGHSMLVVGGGYIGLEAAAVARKLGLEVTLIEMATRILQRVAAEPTSDWFRELHRSHGVEVIEGVALDRLTGEGRVDGAELTDGRRLDCDLVVLGIGISPSTALAATAGIACENGIAVDEMGRTSARGVWAAGDCASFPHDGMRMRLESVGNAIDMAEAVARNMLGADEPYVPRPWFWSDQYDVKLQIAGLGTGHDSVVVRQEAGRSHWYYAGDRLVAVDAMNAPRDYMVGKRLIEMGRSPAPDALHAPDLKPLLKA